MIDASRALVVLLKTFEYSTIISKGYMERKKMYNKKCPMW